MARISNHLVHPVILSKTLFLCSLRSLALTRDDRLQHSRALGIKQAVNSYFKTYSQPLVGFMRRNPVAARLAGINLSQYKLFIYTLSGLIAGVAAIILTARAQSGQLMHGA